VLGVSVIDVQNRAKSDASCIAVQFSLAPRCGHRLAPGLGAQFWLRRDVELHGLDLVGSGSNDVR